MSAVRHEGVCRLAALHFLRCFFNWCSNTVLQTQWVKEENGRGGEEK